MFGSRPPIDTSRDSTQPVLLEKIKFTSSEEVLPLCMFWPSIQKFSFARKLGGDKSFEIYSTGLLWPNWWIISSWGFSEEIFRKPKIGSRNGSFAQFGQKSFRCKSPGAREELLKIRSCACRPIEAWKIENQPVVSKPNRFVFGEVFLCLQSPADLTHQVLNAK